MKRILNPIQMEGACVKVSCGSDQGTAFYVSANLLLTAYHVVLESIESKTDIFIHTTDGKVVCKIKVYDAAFDTCILICEKENKLYLPLLSASSKVNEKCSVFGFPHQGQSQHLSLDGKVAQVLINDKSDFVVGNLNINGDYDYGGLSGSPVIINGSVIGVVLRQSDNRVSAVSIKKIVNLLEAAGLDTEEEYLYHNIPNQFIEEVKTATPNYAVLEQIDEMIGKPGNWFLLQGSPGSGKSTLVASFEPDDPTLVICGRYFVKVPNDAEPITLKSSPGFFLETVENLIGTTITGLPFPKEEISLEDRIKRMAVLFEELGTYFDEKNQKGILIIDGLDEVKNLDEFLGILPIRMPENIKVLLSCTSKDVLPVQFKNEIAEDRVISVTPINAGQCEEFIADQIGKDKLPVDIIQEVAAKSEGHPLYLRYLVNYIRTQEIDIKSMEFEEWVKSIPVIGGDISKYYNSIWTPISAIPDRLWQILILSQLRQPITKEEFFDLLPSQYQLSFNTYFPGIQYLLNSNNNVIEIYHNSFKDYVISKTAENTKQANDLIVTFCEKFPKSRFSINNILFHYSSSSDPEQAVNKCNQDWADQCAIMDVSPDLVINDIKKIIDLSVDGRNTTDMIRLLLLLQRIEFRYDSVFAENANQIALALIAIDKFEQALKYLVRENTLLVDNDDAILFLQLFYENNATKEAAILLSAIDARYRRLLQEGMDSKKGISMDVFILKMNSLTLSMNDDFKEGISKVMNLLRRLRNLQEAALEAGDENNHQTVLSTREHAAMWQLAYTIRRFDIFADSETMSKTTGVKLDEKWAGMKALSALFYKEFNTYNILPVGNNEHFLSLIADIEYLVKTYGYEEDERICNLLISALIEDSKDCDFIEELIGKYLAYEKEFHFREANGVDLNYKGVYRLYFEFLCKGYIDKTGTYPGITKRLPRHAHWESYIITLIKSIAFSEGRLYRLKAAGVSNVTDVQKNLAFLADIDFTLDERSYWDRGYHLPESVFPIIYAKLIRIFIEFNNSEIGKVISVIETKSKNQLGLYSEGFRSCLYEIVKALIKGAVKKELILPIVSLWAEHTVKGVQNRWERTPELLKIIEVYGLLNEKETAQGVFVEMLKTSMGPGWYKEAQFDLLNTVLSLKPGDKQGNKYLNEFAGILDYASGEMTFQRYVRNEKESFVGNLSKQSSLGKAIEYFKFEVLPPPEILLFNAETFTTDSPRIGEGYCLGARNISEQSAVLRILEVEFDPLLKWALCNIFTINDDTFRYLPEYGSHLAKALNTIEEGGFSFFADIHRSVAQIASEKEMKVHLGQFLNSFEKELTETNKKHLEGHLLEKGITRNFSTENNNPVEQTREEKPDTAFDSFNKKYEMDHLTNPQELIEEGFSAFKKEKISIWFGNWSTASNKSKEHLKSLLQSDSEALPYFKEDIKKYDNEAWVMANQAIWFLETKFSKDQVEEIYKIVAEHFSLLVRPEQCFFDKYQWIENTGVSASNDEEVGRFLLWLLNHPVDRISQRAFKSIVQLSEYSPTLMIRSLFDEAITEKPTISTEKCSLILKKIAEKDTTEIVRILKEDDKLANQIKEIRHFSIKKNFLDISINLNKSGYSNLYETIRETIPEVVILTGDVALDESFLESIDYEISELNALQILNRQFCETLLNKIKEYCSPLPIKDFQRSDRYLQRSFYEDKNRDIRFRYLVKYALNMAISKRVDKSNLQEVYELLNK